MSKRTLHELVERLDGEVPENPADPEGVAVPEGLSERALEVAEAAGEAEDPSDPALLVLGRLAACLAAERLHGRARTVLAAALEAAGRNPPRNRFLLAVLHDQLAESLQDDGCGEEALEHARRAERHGREACRPGDPRLLALLNNVGTAHKRAGDFLTAEVYFRQALELADAHDHAPGTLSATAALNLADVLRARGRPDEALPLAERGLAETEEAYGPAAFETADAAGDLASLLRELGRAGPALRHQRRAVAVYERALGAEHELARAARRRLEEWEAAG